MVYVDYLITSMDHFLANKVILELKFGWQVLE